MKHKKLWLIISLVLAGSILLTSCGKVTPTTALTEPPKASEVPGKAVFLTINYEQLPTWVRNFNPFSPDALGSTVTAIYEPMMIYNKSTGELVPWLATGYAWSTNNTVLTFTIRQGVRWSDGEPFTANDVVFTFDMLKNNPALAGAASSVLNEYITSFSARDDHTVEFVFNMVYTPALYDLANQVVVPEHTWKNVSDPMTYTNEDPVATGPFTEVTRFESQIYVLEKNPYYWQEGKPSFQGIRFPAYADNDAANLALVNGDLDWAGNFVPDIQTVYVAQNPENYHYYFVGGDGVLLYLNPSLRPFDNPAVRKAISMGIDRQMIVDTAMFGYIPPADATGLGDTYSVWKDPAAVATGTWVKFDPAAANAALDAAGLVRGSDGIRRDLDSKPMKYELIVVSGWTDWISACQIIAQNMSDLGIEISVLTLEENTWYDEISKGQFQWGIGWGSGGPTPYNFYRGQMSELTLQPVGESADENWGRYVNPEVDRLLEEFAQTSDPAEQKAIMAQIEMIFVQEAPSLPLFPGPDWYEYTTLRFTGFPSADNPYAPGVPYAWSPYNTPLIVLTTIQPK